MCTIDDDCEPSKILNLYNQNIQDNNIFSIIQSRISMILRLHLGQNNIGDKGALILSKSLYTNNIITHLTLESNNIGDSGCTALSEWLSTNTSLLHLGLGGNNIGNKGCVNLGRSIFKNNSLQVLVLCFNQIGDPGFIDFCQQIQQPKTLQSIIFWNNPITNLSGKALEKLLRNTTAITRFEYYDDFVEIKIKKRIKYHLDFNILYQFEYPKKYLLTVSQFMKIWYYLSRNSLYYSISSDLVRIISDFLGVSYFQSVMSWKQRLYQQMLESSK